MAGSGKHAKCHVTEFGLYCKGYRELLRVFIGGGLITSKRFLRLLAAESTAGDQTEGRNIIKKL